MQEINSNIIKATLYQHYRFNMHYIYVCDEIQNSDFVYITNSNMIGEIEVKISISDLKADFKKRVHEFIKRKINISRNYFYFAVPDYILNKAIEVINEKDYYQYGIISILESNGFTHYVNQKYILKIIQKPKLIRPCFDKDHFFNKVKNDMISRMTSKIASDMVNRYHGGTNNEQTN